MPIAVLFDLDNTLIDRNAAHRRYCQEFAKRFLTDRSNFAREEAIREMVDYDRFGYTPRESYFQWLAAQFGSGVFTSAELWQDYQARLPFYFTKNLAVCELLGRLNERYRVAIVSNGSSRNQRRKLVQTGLAECCAQIFISGEVGIEKPNPAIFQLALEALGCDAGSALFVGDDPHRDIAGAAQAGMQTCWIRLGRTLEEWPIQPNFHIQTILELENLLDHERERIDRHA